MEFWLSSIQHSASLIHNTFFSLIMLLFLSSYMDIYICMLQRGYEHAVGILNIESILLFLSRR